MVESIVERLKIEDDEMENKNTLMRNKMGEERG
jgi:hypothetical protein